MRRAQIGKPFCSGLQDQDWEPLSELIKQRPKMTSVVFTESYTRGCEHIWVHTLCTSL